MALPLLAGIAAAAKVAGNIAGGAAQAKAYRDRINDLRAQQQENKNWFDKNYNEDFLHRRSAQALLNQQEESIRERNRQAQAQAAVMGGSQAAVAAQKQANNAALATTANVLSQQEEARKDNIESQYMTRRDSLNQQIDAARQGKAQSVANAMAGVGNAAGDFLANNLAQRSAVTKTPKSVTNAMQSLQNQKPVINPTALSDENIARAKQQMQNLIR